MFLACPHNWSMVCGMALTVLQFMWATGIKIIDNTFSVHDAFLE